MAFDSRIMLYAILMVVALAIATAARALGNRRDTKRVVIRPFDGTIEEAGAE